MVVIEMTTLPQVFRDFLVGIPHALAAKPRWHRVVIGAVIAHRAVRFQAFLESGAIVLCTVTRRRVNQTRAILKRHVVSCNH